jgi:hypothetical protein
LQRCPRHRQRIDAMVIVEAPVLIRLEQREIARRDIAHSRLDPPIAVPGEIGAQEHAIPVHNLRRQCPRPRHIRRIGDVRCGQRADEAEQGESDGDERLAHLRLLNITRLSGKVNPHNFAP